MEETPSTPERVDGWWPTKKKVKDGGAFLERRQ